MSGVALSAVKWHPVAADRSEAEVSEKLGLGRGATPRGRGEVEWNEK